MANNALMVHKTMLIPAAAQLTVSSTSAPVCMKNDLNVSCNYWNYCLLFFFFWSCF